MAILKAVAVFDAKAAVFNRPFFVPSVGMAERSFSDEVNRSSSDNVMYSHPEDFTLYLIGEYDEESANLSAIVPPNHLVNAVSVKKDK